MSQTIITAGDAVNGLSQAAGNDGTLAIQVGPSGAKVNAIALGTDGTPTLLKTPNVTTAQSMVRVNTANGYGSTNTKIRRFTSVVTNQGSDITYADSATLGASFTINTSGVYAISYSDQFSASAGLGISLNTTQPTTNIYTLTNPSEVLSCSMGASASYGITAGGSYYLPAGSVVRPHTDGISTGVNPAVAQFTITRVA
jgi:hypothetical protein